MRWINICLLTLVMLLASFSPACWSESSHQFDFSSRLRHAFVELSPGSDSSEDDAQGRSISGLFRLGLDSQWNSIIKTQFGLDYVETGYQNQHTDYVRFNGEPTILDVPNLDIKLANVYLDFSNFSVNVGRQRLDYDNHRFIGTDGFGRMTRTSIRLDLTCLFYRHRYSAINTCLM